MSLLMVVISFVAFLRIGRGRWYQTTVGGFCKAAVITLATLVATFLATFPVMAVGLAGGVWG
jgi:hypothetical protein